MKQRCNNPKNPRYKDYGGRGIKVLWNSFEEFATDMLESYKIHNREHWGSQTTIDRIDNDGHYCKENCRWATPQQQFQNRRPGGKRKVISL